MRRTNDYDNKDFWEAKYQSGQMGWDIGYASPALTQYCMQLQYPDIDILIPGAGNAYEAEYLHQHGFINIYILDISSTALQRFHQRVPLFPTDHLLCEDFFAHSGQYDLILEQTFFCALHPDLRYQYATHMHKLLKPKGVLAGVLFNDPLYSNRPPYGGNREEYLTYFRHLFTIHHFAHCYNSIPPRDGRELFIELSKE